MSHISCDQSHHVSVDISKSSLGKNNQPEVDHEPIFSISQERLEELLQINDAGSLEQNGGILQIAAALESNVDTGIVGDERDISCRRRAFGFNLDLEGQYNPTGKRFSELILEAFKDSTIILLLCCAMLSLVLGIKSNGLQEGFMDGAIIFLAIIIVVNFSLVFRFLKTRLMLKKLRSHRRVVSVIRYGKMQEIPVSDLVVGDVVFLEAGNQVPADGLFICGDSFKLDDGLMIEKGAKKTSIFRGAKVVEGNCRMLVASVGKNTEREKLIQTVLVNNHDQEPKWQAAIDKMNGRLEKLWLILSLFILSLQVFRCFLQKSASDDQCHSPDSKGLNNTVEDIMNESTRLMKRQGGKANGLVYMLCILLFATRDGLPLGTLVLCFCSSMKIKSFGAKVQKLPSCVTIGLVTSFCLGKTNALALQHSEMAELWIGLGHVIDLSKVDKQLRKIFQEVIAVTSSGQVIEYSLLYWTKQVLGLDMDELYRNPEVLYDEPWGGNGSRNCCMSILKKHEESNHVKMLYWKGAPDFILSFCSHFYDVDGTRRILDEEKRQSFIRLIKKIGTNSFQCFAFACKPEILHQEIDEEQEEGLIYHGFALVCMVGLKITPDQQEIKQAMETFRNLGINVKLVVDEDVNTARIMALNCGILRPGEDKEAAAAIVEASHFRNSSSEAQMSMVSDIRVIANASPKDKLLMVQCLKKREEAVALTSSCIRDSPSFIDADLGIFMDNNNDMNIAEVVKEDADIITGQNIGTIASIMKSGRYICKSLEIFLQLHLTLNLSAFTLHTVLEILKNGVQLSSFHLLWTNLIVETLGAFALAMWADPGTIKETANPRISHTSIPVINKIMWRNIAIQYFYQVTILLVLAMKGKDLFHVDANILRTMIFNCYVMCQICLLIGISIQRSRTFRGETILGTYLFLIILMVILALQALLMEIMRFVSHWEKLDFKKWFICFGIAAFSVPIGCAAEWIHAMIQVMIIYF